MRFVLILAPVGLLAQTVAAEAQILLVNSNFDTDLSGWTSTAGAQWSPDDAEGSSASGSALTTVYVPPRSQCSLPTGVRQCVPAQAWAYEFSGAFRWTGGGVAGVSLGFYASTDCTGEPFPWSWGISVGPPGTPPSIPENVWTPFSGTIQRPPASRSLSVAEYAWTCPGGSISASIDTLSLRAVPPPPPTRFHTLEPCRLFDTRESDGPPLAATTDRKIQTGGRCQIPPTAKSLAINLTVTGATDAGDLRLRASDAPPPDSSTINYGPGQTRANSAIVGVAAGEFVVHSDQPVGSVHLIIDVNGYFE